ncbi:diacylglycerol/lipid kinase family protein [Marihabitans asiaticum]|nr:diacylglycerol kinase family protein [Marihabitans asiaticum]
MSEREFLMIVNEEAGTSDEQRVEQVRRLLAAQADVKVARTGSIDELQHALDNRGSAEVVVCGGDGSLHAVVTALCLVYELDEDDLPALGLIPLGTGNDFARAAGIPEDPEEAARIVLEGPLQPIDIIRDADDFIVVNAVHVGTGDRAGREAKPWKDRLGTIGLGPLGYVIGSVIAGFRKDGWKLVVEVDGEVVADGSTRLMQVAMANGTSIGGGAALAPEAEPGDGRADVVIAESRTRLERVQYALHLKSGDLDRLNGVRRMTGAHVRLRSATGSSFGVNADGELLDPVTEAEWTLQRAAYRLHLPEEADSQPRASEPVR